MRRHPTKRELLAFAENLVDRRSPVSAPLAAHVNACPACAQEVRAMRASLEFIAEAPGLEPSRDLTNQILMNARQLRQAPERSSRPRGRWVVSAVKAMSCAAALILVALVSFAMALQDEPQDRINVTASPESATVQPQGPSPEALRKATAEIETLSAAIRKEGAEEKPATVLEQQKRRAVDVMDSDIAAARAALERNPGCTRASHIYNTNVPRQAETLRSLYVEQTL
ncbi:MAG: hypothetical protein IT368_03635 [Candidatus Hydrogenedentes bacterium]|nr:hypothetical protein [Candidatus Hydrogenedentota bacterium]